MIVVPLLSCGSRIALPQVRRSEWNVTFLTAPAGGGERPAALLAARHNAEVPNRARFYPLGGRGAGMFAEAS